jgi:hypothetical protein
MAEIPLQVVRVPVVRAWVAPALAVPDAAPDVVRAVPADA